MYGAEIGLQFFKSWSIIMDMTEYKPHSYNFYLKHFFSIQWIFKEIQGNIFVCCDGSRFILAVNDHHDRCCVQNRKECIWRIYIVKIGVNLAIFSRIRNTAETIYFTTLMARNEIYTLNILFNRHLLALISWFTF